MGIHLTIEERESYILAVTSGKREEGRQVDSAIEIFQKIGIACREKGINKILFISKATGKLGVFNVLFILENFERIGWSREFQLAYVNLNENTLPDTRFGENAAANRGYHKIKVFANEERAREWLMIDM
ncbi:MAG: hypothetical protein GC171_07170 [Terrimonas sp.]|nr:hypothetical protein [Terrimonas sp.]